MALPNLVSLFLAMTLLAAMPSMSVLLVVTRTLSSGLWHGIVTALGIVTGDLLFLVLVIYGLSAISNSFGSVFFALKLVGSLYLLILGIGLWKSKATALNVNQPVTPSWTASFLSGLLLTIGDQKAILFYIGFLPAFVDLSSLTAVDKVALLLTTILAVGSVKIFYAYSASNINRILKKAQFRLAISRAVGSLLVVTGLYLLVMTLASTR